MIMIIILVLAISGFIGLYSFHRRALPLGLGYLKAARDRSAASKVGGKSKKGFSGFSIIAESSCCKAIGELEGITFSSSDNIQLPLSGCRNSICQCRTVLVRERRKYYRRAWSDGRGELRFEPKADNRRSNRGRRELDNVWSGKYSC